MTTTITQTDLDCGPDMQPTLTGVSGRMVLAQNLLRCTIIEKGQLLSDPNWGFGLQRWLDRGITPNDLAYISRGLAEAYRRDERVLSASVVCSFALGVLTVVADIVDKAGPFRLTLAVSSVTASILGLG